VQKIKRGGDVEYYFGIVLADTSAMANCKPYKPEYPVGCRNKFGMPYFSLKKSVFSPSLVTYIIFPLIFVYILNDSSIFES